jgi:acetyl esterase/lipase
MSVLSIPVVADALSRLFAAVVPTAPKSAVAFPEIAGRTSLITIPTRHGAVEATVYQPPEGAGRPGVYVNAHGGGFVVGHREQDDPWCRYLAAHAGVVVVNTDYAVAPHRRFPIAVEQIYDVVSWAAAPEREWDGERLCVGGQSAGGNLSAAAARLALENGGPAIALQVLHYAPLDLVTALKDKVSKIGSKAVMKPWMAEIFDTAYIPSPSQRRDPLASPAWGANGDELAGIAPALVVTAEYDRLRGEAHRYATKLEAVDALAEYYEVAGVDHGYNIMSGAAYVTRHAYDRIVEHVVRALNPDEGAQTT